MIGLSTIFALGLTTLAAMVTIVLFGACGQNHESLGGSAEDQSRVSHGKSIFRGNCAACHGANGEGQPDWYIRKPDGPLPAPPLNGDGHTWHHGDGTLYQIVSRGGAIYESTNLPKYKSGMPAFGETLSHQEIIAVISYIKSLWGDKMAEGLDLPIKESQALVSETDPFPKEMP